MSNLEFMWVVAGELMPLPLIVVAVVGIFAYNFVHNRWHHE